MRYVSVIGPNGMIVVNTNKVNYFGSNQIVFENGTTLEASYDVSELMKLCNEEKVYHNTDPNREATQKQLTFCKKISDCLNIKMPIDTKFNTVKKYIEDNIVKFRELDRRLKIQSQIQPDDPYYDEKPF